MNTKYSHSSPSPLLLSSAINFGQATLYNHIFSKAAAVVLHIITSCDYLFQQPVKMVLLAPALSNFAQDQV